MYVKKANIAMEFNKEIAQKIVKKFNLSNKTINVWRNRNKIPDKYADEGYKPVPEVSKADKIILKRIEELRDCGYINFSVLTEISGVDIRRLNDSIRGKGRISKEELNKIVIEIKKLKAFINNNLQNTPIKMNALFGNKLLKFYSINGKDDWAKAMYYAMNKKNQLSQTDFIRLKDNYINVYIMLNI